MATPSIDVFSLIGMSLSSLGSAYNQYQATKAQGDYQRSMYNLNARMAEFMAADALAKGEKESQEVLRAGYKREFAARRAGKKAIGSQMVAFASQGVDINTGSPGDVIDETRAMSEIDQLEIRKNAELDALITRNNAWREAWGFKVQASEYGSRAGFADLLAKNKAKNTLLAGGTSALSYGTYAYGMYRRDNPSESKQKETPRPAPSFSSGRSLRSGSMFTPRGW